jgi:hypothetical protein
MELNRIAQPLGSYSQEVKTDFFLHSLNPELKDMLVGYARPRMLQEAVLICQELESRLTARRREKPAARRTNSIYIPQLPQSTLHHSPLDISERMDIDSLTSRKVSPQELQRRMSNHLCRYCASPDHTLDTCPILPTRRRHSSSSSSTLTPSASSSHLSITNKDKSTYLSISEMHPVHEWSQYFTNVKIANTGSEYKALIDSGASATLLDRSLVTALKLPVVKLEKPIIAMGFNDQIHENITHVTTPIKLQIY